VVLSDPIAAATTKDGWATFKVDLSDYAGQSPRIDLLDEATNWTHRAAYWTAPVFEQQQH
jgi:hypothetical protein